jgi:hypothetical protein
MTSTITHMAAQEQVRDRVRQAEQRRRAAAVRRPRRARLALPRFVLRALRPSTV